MRGDLLVAVVVFACFVVVVVVVVDIFREAPRSNAIEVKMVLIFFRESRIGKERTDSSSKGSKWVVGISEGERVLIDGQDEKESLD